MLNNNYDDQLSHQDMQRLLRKFERLLFGEASYFFDHSSYEQLIDYYNKRNSPRRVLSVLKFALEQHPFSTVFRIKKAQALIEENRYHDALDTLEETQGFAPNDVEISIVKAEVYTIMGDVKAATDLLESILDSFTDKQDRVDIYLLLAEIADLKGSIYKEYTWLRKTLQLDPTNETALNRIGYCIEEQACFSESVEIHKKILDKAPFCYTAWYNLGNAYYGLGLYRKAVDAFKYATAIKPDFDLAYSDLGDSLFELENYEAAIKQYQEAAQCNGYDEELHFNIGLCQLKIGNIDEAFSQLENVLTLDELNHEALFWVGHIYQLRQDIVGAIGYYKQALDIDKNNELYLEHLYKAYLLQGKNSLAADELLKLIQVAPEKVNYWYQLVKVYVLMDLVETAYTVINIAKDKLPNKQILDLLYAEAACLYLLGKKPQAERLFKKGLKYNYEANSYFFELMAHKTIGKKWSELVAVAARNAQNQTNTRDNTNLLNDSVCK